MQLFVDQLGVERGSRRVIDGLTLQVVSGEALVLVGPNGAGKTTLIRTLAGLLQPSSGKIRLEGGDPEKEIAAQSHYVGHQNALKASLTVEENLAFWQAYLGGSSEDAIGDALEAFALEPLAAIPAGYLSAGQKRRACLARLVVTPRPIWLLDEPTVSLDAASVALLAACVGKHVDGGGLVVAATHIPLGLATERRFEIGRSREEAA